MSLFQILKFALEINRDRLVLIRKFIISQTDESELIEPESGFFNDFAACGLLGGFP